jgi:putative flippase GtrA
MEVAARRLYAPSRHLRILNDGPDPSVERRADRVDVEIVVPVYNEAAQLAQRVHTLRSYLDRSFPFSSLITIVDNGSDDGTGIIASQLAATTPGVCAVSLSRKGRGHALRSAWSTSNARVVAYMDVDLSTSLSALLPLVAPLLSGHGQVATGTRLARGSRVVRGPKRELISRAYNLLLRLFLRTHVSDAQCGFKALDRQAAQLLLPLIDDEEWFFDTELLVTAERLGMRVSEVPVDWVDDPDSRVKIVPTAMADLRGIWRMAGRRAHARVHDLQAPAPRRAQATAEQLFSFAGVGALSTVGYLLLFAACRPALGALASNAVALALCTLLNTSVHRALADPDRTGGPAHRLSGRPRFLAAAAGLFSISMALTTGALLTAHAVSATSLTSQLVAVTIANAVAALVRFTVLRAWVFRPEIVVGPDPSLHAQL